MYNPTVKRFVVQVFRRLFLRRSFYPLHRISFTLSLHGMGMLNYENTKLTGERAFLKKLLRRGYGELPVVLDIGASDGRYSAMVKSIAPEAQVYAFEPHPLAFKRLEACARSNGVIPFNVGCSDEEGPSVLYDYADKDYSAHASFHKGAFEEIHKKQSISYPVGTVTLDDFVERKLNIGRIRLVKTDTEGNDLKVLRGAQRLIAQKSIDVIQFEFNEMNVISRVFFKDFVDLLSDYRFYRLLPDGPVAIGEYYPVSFELFAFQNIAAIRKDLEIRL
jgi:FkbM family methyltransferase